MLTRRLFPSLALFLASCVGIGSDGRSYPSLVRRPIENGMAVSTVPAAPKSVAPSATDVDALAARIAPLTVQSAKGKAAFDAAYGSTADQVRGAQNVAVLDESWVAANVSLSALDGKRMDSVSALAGLDMLYTERMKAIAEGTASGGTDQIVAARDVALGVVDGQNDRLDGLKAMLKRP
ncbi:MAG: hypothetical protein ABI395_03415 [Sphingobium sp.]